MNIIPVTLALSAHFPSIFGASETRRAPFDCVSPDLTPPLHVVARPNDEQVGDRTVRYPYSFVDASYRERVSMDDGSEP